MIQLKVVLMILAVICFTLSAVDVKPAGRGNLQSAGLAFWALATMIP